MHVVDLAEVGDVRRHGWFCLWTQLLLLYCLTNLAKSEIYMKKYISQGQESRQNIYQFSFLHIFRKVYYLTRIIQQFDRT